MSILNTLREENNFNREEIISAMEAMMDNILNEVAMDSAIESTDFYADPCVSIGKSYLGAMEAISEDKDEETLEKLDDLEEELEKSKKEKDPKKKWKILKMVISAVLALAASLGAVFVIKKVGKFKDEFEKLKKDNEALKNAIDFTGHRITGETNAIKFDINKLSETLTASIDDLRNTVNKNK